MREALQGKASAFASFAIPLERSPNRGESGDCAFGRGRAPHLAPECRLGRSRNIEMLAFPATEIHRPFMHAMLSPADAGSPNAWR